MSNRIVSHDQLIWTLSMQCDLVKQVVMAKLEREELEDELVKSKLAVRFVSSYTHVRMLMHQFSSPIFLIKKQASQH